MIRYIIRRFLYMIPTVVAISVVAFIIIQLPPGDFVSMLTAQAAAADELLEIEEIEALRRRYGLGEHPFVQYWRWVSGIILRGDFGFSFQWNRPVSTLIWDRIGLTFVLSISTMFFIWLVSFPIGVYSAIRKYSVGDYVATVFGFLGLATPNFLLALILMYISFRYFGRTVGGLFSPQYVDAAWSFAKFVDMLGHLWIPMVVLGTAGTAGLIRLVRANLLDELSKPYVVAARAKGLSERRLLLKYPVRISLNFFVSSQNNILVGLVSGAAIVSIVLSLPTAGPLLLRALLAQDMYLAGSFILMLSILNVISTLISDIALAWLDPRIRYDA